MWGWLVLVAVLALGAVGVVVLTRGDDKDSVGPSATVVSMLGSSVASATADAVAGAPVGITGDIDNPVPLGTIADIGNGWRLQILEVVPDGAAVVASASDFNDPPPAGSTFTLVTVALGYFGLDEPASAFRANILPVGAADLGTQLDCGQLPNQLGPQPGASSTPLRLTPTALATAAGAGAGWTFAVSGAARGITDLVEAENEFNDPPPDGFRFIGVEVTYSYAGSDPTQASVVVTGDSVSGAICFVVPIASPNIVVYASGDFDTPPVMYAVI